MPTRQFRVDLSVPPGRTALSARIQLGYDSGLVSLPGTGPTPAPRFTNFPSNTTVSVNDLDYAVEVVATRALGLPSGSRLFYVNFDSCQSAPAASVADFGCTVLECSGQTGMFAGCNCAVLNPP